MQCKHVVPLLAPFGQGSAYDAQTEPFVKSALCNRLLSEYVGSALDRTQSERFDRITLRSLTEFIRRREAAARHCTPDEICVIVLVDDVLNVIDGVVTTPHHNVTTLLDVVCEAQQNALTEKRLTFAVVTSLDVCGVHARVTVQARQPLHSIPLYPCSTYDIDTGGHFRSLEKIWISFRDNPSHFTAAPAVLTRNTAACILDVMARRLNDPLLVMYHDTDRIGAVFSKQGLSKTLHQAASHNVDGVFYRATTVRLERAATL
ncbi:Hypothetical protein, putative [Bodo saltans]|uniref:Uncharacterized protein n=1 Tax=Bodo saltans TaxID=75058 RepID=A0A0S4KNE0_BODSA|nr:Hypothetical protein, putative [Bodo saltans]|eukprot:CUI15134.1 Hypothetical protein, putative [Bodo saltans]